MKQIPIFLLCIIILTSSAVTISSSQNQNYNQTIISAENEVGWHLEKIKIEEAWATTQGSSEIVVAVLDSGINFTHPDLTHAQWINTDEIPDNFIDDDDNGYVDDVYGWDFVFDDNNPEPLYTHIPLNNHGTFIAGIIAAKNDGYGIVGVAPNIKIMNLQIWYDKTTGDDEEVWASRDEIGNAINYAVDNGADVISCSFSAKKKIFEKLTDVAYYDEMEAAVKQGVVIVASAGNDDSDVKRYPACFEFVIGVGATDYYDNRADYSSYGKSQVDFVAPGGEDDGNEAHRLNSTNFDGTYTMAHGTSYSAPIVAGVIALMKSVDNTLTPKLIRCILEDSAIDLGDPGRDDDFGYGMVDAAVAVLISLDASTVKCFPGFGISITIIGVIMLQVIIIKNKRVYK